MEKKDLFMRLCEIRDRFMKDSDNRSLSLAIGKIYLEGYLTGLFDAGFLDEEKYEELKRDWVN
jgi:hypothetical protein